jgi:hypothetical protein
MKLYGCEICGQVFFNERGGQPINNDSLGVREHIITAHPDRYPAIDSVWPVFFCKFEVLTPMDLKTRRDSVIVSAAPGFTNEKKIDFNPLLINENENLRSLLREVLTVPGGPVAYGDPATLADRIRKALSDSDLTS